MNTSTNKITPDRSLSFQQMSAIVRGNLRRTVLMSAGLIGLIAAATFLMPKQYTSTATLVVDTRSRELIDGSTAIGVTGTVYLATQAEIIKSERVAREVIASLDLGSDPELQQLWAEETDSTGDYISWLVNKLNKKLSVTPAKDSSVITIAYTADDPDRAAAITNGYLDKYLSSLAAMRSEPARNYNAFFEEQTREGREQLEVAQRALSDYERKHGILVSDARLDVETMKLSQLSSEFLRMQEVAVETNSRSAEAAARPDVMTDALRDVVVTSLQGEIARKESELQQVSERLGSKHPAVVERTTNLAGLKARLNEQLRRISANAASNRTVTNTRLTEMRRALERQRETVSGLKASRDVANVLQRDIDHAQKNYEMVLARLSQTRMEKEAAQAPVSVIRRASAPGLPSSPRVLLNLAIGTVLSVMLSIGIVLALELRNRRMRIAEDVTRYFKLPLLTTMPVVQIGEAAAARKSARLTRQILQLSPAGSR